MHGYKYFAYTNACLLAVLTYVYVWVGVCGCVCGCVWVGVYAKAIFITI